MKIPNDVKYLIDRLRSHGFEAYAVGGCVRDALLGKEPNDWDITTSAQPSQMQKCFSDHRVIETGLKHGTLTVMLHGDGYEITTYRKDGEYTDHRRPDNVEFVTNLAEDLERRDFTVNAMATSNGEDIIDLFGGKDDLARGIIRCVGSPEKRFTEDALRILRAVRFASVYDFEIDPETATAASALRETLSNVSPERIFVELKKLLCGKGVQRILTQHPDILFTVFPELEALSLGKWADTARALAKLPVDPAYRIAALFCKLDNGADIVKTALMRMKPDTNLYRKACFFVSEHEFSVCPERINVRKEMVRIGAQNLIDLIPLWQALCDNERLMSDIDSIKEISSQLISENACVSISQLDINGNDLASIGIKGKQTGLILKTLLDQVASESLENKKQALLEEAQRLL